MADDDAGITIRDAREDERDAIRELTFLAYEQYAELMEPSAWQGLKHAIANAVATTAPAQRIVAERDGVLIGSVLLFPSALDAYQGPVVAVPVPEMSVLAVDPAARGLGIGRLLVEECIRRARRLGANVLGLHTSVSMRQAKALYERMGFERYPADDFQPGGTELVMAYRLPL